MKIFLTAVFLLAWINNLDMNPYLWDVKFWCGILIILCGCYFSIEELESR